MDDLNNDPQKVAEDIIKQATEELGFRQTATNRIFDILTAYHQLQEIAKTEEQKENETDVYYEGALAWKTVEGQKKGPFCARCHGNYNELKPMIALQKGLWECTKCSKRFNDRSGERQLYANNN